MNEETHTALIGLTEEISETLSSLSSVEYFEVKELKNGLIVLELSLWGDNKAIILLGSSEQIVVDPLGVQVSDR